MTRHEAAYQRTHARTLRWRAAGGCTDCGEPTTINPHTGKPYWLCRAHRILHARRMAKVSIRLQQKRAYVMRRRVRRQAEGRCMRCPAPIVAPALNCVACRAHLAALKRARTLARSQPQRVAA